MIPKTGERCGCCMAGIPPAADVKIATVRGVHCFENIYPFSGYYLDMENANSWALAGAFLPATMHLHCNNVNPAYYGFSSMESNIIVSEAVEDFVDPEAE